MSPLQELIMRANQNSSPVDYDMVERSRDIPSMNNDFARSEIQDFGSTSRGLEQLVGERVRQKQRGDYQNLSLEEIIAKFTGQDFSPNLIQKATANPMSDVGGSPSLMDLLRQY